MSFISPSLKHQPPAAGPLKDDSRAGMFTRSLVEVWDGLRRFFQYFAQFAERQIETIDGTRLFVLSKPSGSAVRGKISFIVSAEKNGNSWSLSITPGVVHVLNLNTRLLTFVEPVVGDLSANIGDFVWHEITFPDVRAPAEDDEEPSAEDIEDELSPEFPPEEDITFTPPGTEGLPEDGEEEEPDDLPLPGDEDTEASLKHFRPRIVTRVGPDLPTGGSVSGRLNKTIVKLGKLREDDDGVVFFDQATSGTYTIIARVSLLPLPLVVNGMVATDGWVSGRFVHVGDIIDAVTLKNTKGETQTISLGESEDTMIGVLDVVKTAILPYGKEWVGMVCPEAPEAWFEDVMTVTVGRDKRISPEFIAFCEPHTIKVVSAHCEDFPGDAWARVSWKLSKAPKKRAKEIFQSNVTVSAMTRPWLADGFKPRKVTVRICGVRKGMAGRFRRYSADVAAANQRFWSTAHQPAYWFINSGK